MKIIISEKQYKSLIDCIDVELDEQESAEGTSGTDGTSSTGEKKGYPEVGKWESGVVRGAANQIGNTKWSETVGANLVRGKANKLK